VGQLFGNLTNTGVTGPNGQTQFFNNPNAAAVSYAKQYRPQASTSSIGGDLENPGNVSLSTPDAREPRMFKPSYQQAADTGPAGTPNALSPGLSKLGKVLTFLTAAGQGALAGRAASEQAVIQSGGRRSGGAGMGFQAGYQLPFLRAMQPLQLEQQQAETQLAQAGAQPVQTPYGQVPASYLPKFLSPMLKLEGTRETNQTHQNIAQQANQNKLDIVGLQTAISAQKGAKFLPDTDPNTGQQFYRVINPYGQEIGRTDVNVIPSLMARSSSTVEYKEDADGNIVALPKTTTSGPNIPRGPAPAAPGGRNQPLAAGPQNAPATTNRQPSGPRVVMQGKAAKDVGLAYDPNANEYVQTTRSEATNQGYQQFNKITAKEQEENRQLNNRLYDVAVKISRYEESLKAPITEAERGNIAGLLSGDKLKVGAFGAELPVDRLNQAMDAENIKGLSKAAQNRIIAYYNARESMLGYQRVLTGGSKSNEKGLELNLQALPSPVMPDDFTRSGIDQFKENIKVAGQGLPRMPGIKRAVDILASPSSGNTPAQPRTPQPMTNIPAFLSRIGVQ
jgi:hypothetical protein